MNSFAPVLEPHQIPANLDHLTPPCCSPALLPIPFNGLAASDHNTQLFVPSGKSPPEWSFSSIMAHFGETNNSTSRATDNEALSLSSPAWCQTLVPARVPLSSLKQHSMEFTLRILRTWPHMMASGYQTLPMFHNSQMNRDSMPVPLANCYIIAKMWHSQCEISTSLVHETAVREVINLFQNVRLPFDFIPRVELIHKQYQKYDDASLLAALQSLVIYLIIFLFPTQDQGSVSVIDTVILANLRQLINYVSSAGLTIEEEEKHTRPSWEAWINIASKRRAVFSLYLIHWALSAYHGLSPFDCEELGHMLAPAPKVLWQATNRDEWELHYLHWLTVWGNREYLQRELAKIKPGVSLDRRSEQWLGETDELGMLLMSLGGRACTCLLSNSIR